MTLATALYGSGIKSVQQGTITIANASASNTATISSVNTAKAFVLYGGNEWGGSDGLSSSLPSALFRIALTNATTVTASRGNTESSNVCSYTVVEFN